MYDFRPLNAPRSLSKVFLFFNVFQCFCVLIIILVACLVLVGFVMVIVGVLFQLKMNLREK
jgi:hypothetical protein